MRAKSMSVLGGNSGRHLLVLSVSQFDPKGDIRGNGQASEVFGEIHFCGRCSRSIRDLGQTPLFSCVFNRCNLRDLLDWAVGAHYVLLVEGLKGRGPEMGLWASESIGKGQPPEIRREFYPCLF